MCVFYLLGVENGGAEMRLSHVSIHAIRQRSKKLLECLVRFHTVFAI
jgi:hypothetical protein